MGSDTVRTEGEVSIDVPPGQMFRLWRDVENLPTLLGHLDATERLEGLRSRWTIRGTGESPLVWDMEADEEVENERVGWHSAPGAPIDGAVSVSFTPLDGGAATRVHVDVSYAPAENAPSLDLERGLVNDLARMKRRIEANEKIARDEVDKASVDSFPASDPPAWTTGKQ